jgi:uncharacterized protein (DUF1800 family)
MALSRSDAAHLLRRAGFGGTLAEVDQRTGADPAAVADALLDTSAAPASVTAPGITGGGAEWEKMVVITETWLDHCADAPVPLVEKMVLFWHGHLVTGRDKAYNADYLWRANSLQRTHALGNVHTLVQAMAIEPAMLIYLDNKDNYADEPNQNFGRELLELFLLGVGNYTEQDVDAATRAWTGHHLDEKNEKAGQYVFKAKYHDNGPKTFFGVTKNWNGPEIIDFLFTDPTQRQAVAQFLVRKFWSFFAHPNPPANVVTDLANVFITANFEMKPLLRALFLRPEFYAPASTQGLIRSPIEYIVNVMRQTGLRSDVMKPMWVMKALGQDPFDPPNVSGWRQNAYWLSAASAAQRADWARGLGDRLKNQKRGPFIDVPGLPLDQAVPAVFNRLGIDAPSAVSRQALTNWFTTQRASPHEGWAETLMLCQVALLLPELQLA